MTVITSALTIFGITKALSVGRTPRMDSLCKSTSGSRCGRRRRGNHDFSCSASEVAPTNCIRGQFRELNDNGAWSWFMDDASS